MNQKGAIVCIDSDMYILTILGPKYITDNECNELEKVKDLEERLKKYIKMRPTI